MRVAGLDLTRVERRGRRLRRAALGSVATLQGCEYGLEIRALAAKALEISLSPRAADAKKQADLVNQRIAAADNAKKKAAEATKKAEHAESKKAEAVKQEVAAVAAAPAPVAKAQEAPKAAPQEPAPAKAAPEPAAVPKKPGPMSRSERERLADEEAARKALAAASRAPAPGEVERAPTVVASVAPAPGAAPEASAKPAVSENETLYQQALALEQGGKASEALRIYRRAARAGSGKAAKRLGEIYDRGVPGVSRDYAESLQWYETARQLGERIEMASSRGDGPRAPAIPFPRSMPREPAAPAPAPAASAPRAPEVPPARSERNVAPTPSPSAPTPSAPAAVPERSPVTPVPAETPRQESSTVMVVSILVALALAAAVFFARGRRRQVESSPAPKDALTGGVRPAAPTVGEGKDSLFVSYSHKDRGRVEPIVSAIEGMGRRVWMDRNDITGQAGWAGQIVRAIRECRAVVLMASPNSYASDQVVRELYLAMNHRKTIVPIDLPRPATSLRSSITARSRAVCCSISPGTPRPCACSARTPRPTPTRSTPAGRWITPSPSR